MLPDSASLHEAGPIPKRAFNCAAVAGGGIAGLLAARVLSDYFERVTLVERDAHPRDPHPRKGVPQGRHVHVLLIRGRTILERYFAGLVEELHAAGAVVVNAGRELGWKHRGRWRAQYDTDLSLLSMSRPLLESHVAGRVRALPNVEIIHDARVQGFAADGDGSVAGLRIGVSGRPTDDIKADLVVDAMGRGSNTPKWIAELGFAEPQTELVPARVTYASCVLPRLAEWPQYRALLVSGGTRGASLVPIEGGRWLLTGITYFDQPTPRDFDAMRAYMRTLDLPDTYESVWERATEAEVVHFRFAGNQRRRYDRLTRFPDGLVVLGDGVCSFNPAYGQGMTVSAIEAECLHAELKQAKQTGGIASGFGQRWFAAIGPVTKAAWDGVLLEDLRFAELADHRPARLRPMQWYMGRVHQATYRSPFAVDQFYRVANFLDAPTALFRPRMIAEALIGG